MKSAKGSLIGLLLAAAFAGPRPSRAAADTATQAWNLDAVDSNGQSDPNIVGYRVFASTLSFLQKGVWISTAQAMANASITQSTVAASVTTYAATLSPGATNYFRLAAYDSSGVQSSFNTDASGNAVQLSTFVPALPVITSVNTASGTVGTAFSYQITATNSPTSFNATGLPAGLSVNATSGLISGTPSAAGTSSTNLSATNSGGTGASTLILTINAAAPPPPSAASLRIFYSDLDSGPNTGGLNGQGSIVTIYGKGFGASKGSSSVSIGGGVSGSILLWSDTKIAFQLGASAKTGSIVVNVSGKGTSNGVPFTVRSGNIYFVATNGSDSNSGSDSSPWATILHAKSTIAAGDIAYIEDGVSQTAQDNFSACLSIETSGTSGNPKALVAYPGATVTVGSTGSSLDALRIPNTGVSSNYWTIAGMQFLTSGASAISLGGGGSNYWRVVGNYFSCPTGNGETGCFSTNLVSNVKFLGNEVTKTGIVGASKQYHSVYFSTDSNDIEVGWNHIHDNNTCRALQFHSSPLCVPTCGSGDTTGHPQFDLHVHDNLIHGDACDGINFATIDPSKGTVEAYNNIVYDVGQGPAPPDGDANYACVYSPGYVNTGPAGSGQVKVYDNTVYNCGSHAASWGGNGGFGSADSGAGLSMLLQNNITYQLSGEPYLEAGFVGNGSNNLWYGNGAPPSSGFTNNYNTDPKFASLSAFDFHLSSGSPAIDTGLTIAGLLTDFDGVTRPQGAAFDLGAYEYITVSFAPPAAVAPPKQPRGLTLR